MSSPGSHPGTSTTLKSEVSSLADRVGYLQALRAAFAIVVVAAALFAREAIRADVLDVVMGTALYLCVTAAAEAGRRAGKGRGLTVIGGMLLLDGVFLAWVIYASGGVDSPLRFLPYLHLIAVTLLGSYRTGLKIALWHSLLFFVVFYAQVAGILETLNQDSALFGTRAEFYRTSIFSVTGFWMIAIGTAAFSALNERELRRRQNDLEALSDMGPRMESATDPAAIAQILLDTVCEKYGFNRGLVLGKHGDTIPLLAFKGPAEITEIYQTLDASVQEVWDTRRVKLAKKLDPDVDPRVSMLLPLARNLVVVPLFAEGEPVGAMVLELGGKSARIERRVVTMVTQFATHAALELRNAWLLDQIRKMAQTDALTQLANRGTFESALERELSRAARSGEQITLVMLDIDHFKSLNDTYGHQTGDEVLRMASAALSKDCRDFDTPARYGGEEFAVIMPNCSSRESLAAAERLRRAMANIDSEVKITVSAGVATYPSHAGDHKSLVKAADEALYESKRSGRDRVTRSRRRGGQVRPRARSQSSRQR